jgi:hypothetical protein
VRSVGRPRAWDPEVIDQAVPELPKAIPNTNAGRSTAEPPVELMPEALKVWRGEKPKAKHTGEIDRSGSLRLRRGTKPSAGASTQGGPTPTSGITRS